MEFTNLDIQKIVEREAAKRRLPVTDFALEFHFEKLSAVSCEVRVAVCDIEEAIRIPLSECTVEKALTTVMDKLFYVDLAMHRDIAEYFLDWEGYTTFDRVIDGIHVYVDFDGDYAEMSAERITAKEWIELTHNFDTCLFMTLYEKMRDEREHEFETIRATEESLRRSA
jgi:hypothetical protein